MGSLPKTDQSEYWEERLSMVRILGNEDLTQRAVTFL